MAYDEALAAKLRALVPDATEKKMFGGLAFLVRGNMAIAASGQGGLLVRVDPDRSDELVRTTAAEPMAMGGRTMTGWLRVPTPATDAELADWVACGVGYARTLPPK